MSNIDKLEQKYNYKIVYQIKENKKVFVIILIIFLIAILLGSYAIYKNSSKTETASKIEKSEKLEKKAERKLKEAKKSGDKEEIAKAEKELKEAEEKTEEVKKSVNSSTSNASKPSQVASKPSTNTSSSAISTSKPSSKPKEKTKVWIVDKPAWTETVTKTRTETKYRPTWWINVNGSHLVFYSEAAQEAKLDELDSQGIPSSWGNGEDEAYTVQVPYTETITHPEQGHWEYR